MSDMELKTSGKTKPTITYADTFDGDQEAGLPTMDRNRYPSMGRSLYGTRERRASISSIRTARTIRSMEIQRTISRRRTLDPETTLPIGFRTLSIHVDGDNEKAPVPIGKGRGRSKAAAVELTNLDWHRLTVEELSKILQTSTTDGLTVTAAKSILAKDGPNKLTPVSNRWAQRIFWYIFVCLSSSSASGRSITDRIREVLGPCLLLLPS